MKSRNRLAAQVSWLGLAVALAVTIAGPAGFFVIAYAEVRHDLSFAAHLKANRLAKYIYSHRELWQYQIASLSDLLDVPEADDAESHQRIFDATGKLVLETGAAPAPPVTTTSAAIVVEQSVIGRIETSATLRRILLETGLVGLFSGLLGFAMFLTLRWLPIRIIDKTTLHFETALDNMARALCMFDAERRLLVVNTCYPELFGIAPEKIVLGMTEPELQALSKVARSGPEAAVAGEWASGEGALLYLANGTVIAGFRRPMADGGVVVTYDDVTEHSQAEEKIYYMARHDALTELPNRRLFHEELDYALRQAAAHERVTVLYLGIDDFKIVNDTHGHPVGDRLLQQIAERLRGTVRPTDTLARMGGDEFAMILNRLIPPFDGAALAGRIVQLLGEPYVVDGQQIVVGTSIGIAVSPNDGTATDELLKNADLALQLAKAEGRGTHRHFEPELEARVKQRHAMEMDLRRAIAMEEFELFYQPIIAIASEEIVGFEALLRWNHPERGLVPPGDFIATAEATGQIVAIGEWVIRTACHEAAGWPVGLTVAVNLSPIQIKNANLVPVIKAALAGSGLAAGSLELEVTESVMLQEDGITLRVMGELHDLGLRISMDDFGTGYSSLGSLRKFPFDRIKIDKSFVSEMSDRDDSLPIIRAVSAIGASLGMATTAEGVETRAQFERVKEEGCTEAQGYLFSRPKPATEVPALLAEHRRHINPQASATLAERGVAKAIILDKTKPPLTDHEIMPSAWPDCAEFEAALLAGDRATAASMMEQSLARGRGMIEFELHVIQPALYQIGEKWQKNQVSVVHEHLATAIAQSVMGQGMVKCKRAHPNGKKVLLACVEGNPHAVGLQMVTDAFELAGWKVNFVGANVPTASLVRHVVSWKPDLLGLSVSFPHQLRIAKEVIARLNESLGAARPPVIIGGLAVNSLHNLADGVGADAWSPDAAAAVVAGDRLVAA